MKKTKQLEYWQGKFGDEYIKRNSDLRLFSKRRPFFKKLLSAHPDISSILEVGCNIGGNLHVLQSINSQLRLSGIEPNEQAVKAAQKNLPKALISHTTVFDVRGENLYDLVFTSGVLIHIADKDFKKALQTINRLSRKYILSIEYYASARQPIQYRDLTDALFKRPYDKEWLAINKQLTIIDSGFLDMSSGFDNCHWWLFKKNEH